MEIGQLYQFALVLVLVGLIVGVGVLILDKFSATSGVTASAQTSLNASRDAVGGIASNWMGLIVTIGVLAIILFLVIRSFGVGGRR
jgi:hypothetical protein